MKVVNKTGHPVIVYDAFPSNGGKVVARFDAGEEVRIRRGWHTDLDVRAEGAPLYVAAPFYLDPPLPEETDDTLYIVSSIIATQMSDRRDLVAPGRSVNQNDPREERGCIGLVFFHPPRRA
jgi:hypothetical protein